MIDAIILIAVGLLFGTLGGWYLGYHTGSIDAQCGQRQCWPWSTPEELDD